MIEHEPNVRALKREWLAARMIAAVGGMLLIAVGAVAAIAWWQSAQPGNAVTIASAPNLPPHTTQPNPAPSQAEARREEGVAICTAALSTAENLGLVPNFATLDGGDTKATGVQGRYVCGAKTDAERYSVTFDLTCTNLSAGNCIALYNITLGDGTVLYRRS